VGKEPNRVLIKNAEALENMNKVNVLITDKREQLLKENLCRKVFSTENKEEDLLQMIASLNQYSEHGASRSQFCKSEKGYFAGSERF
jgi:Cu2+-exporting ATPase